MAEEMQENDLIAKGMEEETQEIESQIKAAMSSRADHFKEQSEYAHFLFSSFVSPKPHPLMSYVCSSVDYDIWVICIRKSKFFFGIVYSSFVFEGASV